MSAQACIALDHHDASIAGMGALQCMPEQQELLRAFQQRRSSVSAESEDSRFRIPPPILSRGALFGRALALGRSSQAKAIEQGEKGEHAFEADRGFTLEPRGPAHGLTRLELDDQPDHSALHGPNDCTRPTRSHP
jgi:hypothetical protein